MACNSAVYMSISSALANIYSTCSDGVFEGLAWSMPNQHIFIPTKSFLADTSVYTAGVLIFLASSFTLSYSRILTLGRDLHEAITNGFMRSMLSGVAC